MPLKLPLFYDYVFPNFILPNATPVAQGIINYLNTQYSNRLREESFFESRSEDFNDNNPFYRMFGTHLGLMPNSLSQSYTYLKQHCFRHMVELEENSVFFGKQTRGKYIYPIKVTLHFARFTGFDRLGLKQNGEFFWKHISEEVLCDLKNGKACIFLDWANENFIAQPEYNDLHKSLELSGLPKESIVLSINSFNGREVYESWFPEHERRLEVRNLPYLMTNISHFFDVNPQARVNDLSFYNSREKLREHYFLFPNHRGRPHRLGFIFKLASENLLDLGDWSLLDSTSFDTAHYEAGKIFSLTDNIHQLKGKFPHTLKDEPHKTFESEVGWEAGGTSRPYLNSYFYIASETYTHLPYKSITEKVFKPIANLQPFFFIAFPGALEELRKLGFRTFSPWIDESYDNEHDYVTRMNKIFTEIQKLCSMPKLNIHNWYWEMKDILIYNRNLLLEKYKSEPLSLEFIEHLYNKVRP